MSTPSRDTVKAIEWTGNALRLLDQRLLPVEETYLEYSDVTGIVAAIRDMVVRGAPAIGITAAYGVVLAARQRYREEPQRWAEAIEADFEALAQSRPTAVNLFWALDNMRKAVRAIAPGQHPEPPLLAEAVRIHESDREANRAMGELGAELIRKTEGQGRCILTHCNTGSLATGGFGTALGVIRAAYEKGLVDHVFADETRPWLQGARLTAWELMKDGIPVSINADGASAHIMKTRDVGWVIVGADRITANGDVANKIGTYNLAIQALHHGVNFMVVAPSSTIDMNLESGDEIPIEEREEAELLSFNGKSVAPAEASAFNPVFDVTPADLVDVIVTEKGVVKRPNKLKMARLMSRSRLH